MNLLKLLNRKEKLETDQDLFDLQVDRFLEREGFPVNDELRALFGTFVQHSNDSEDFFIPSIMAARIRKALSIRCAFYVIHPSRREKKEDVPVVQTTSEDLVQKA